MDIEATMQFILESQARSEIRLDRVLTRADKAEARMDRSEARMEKHEAYVKAMDKRLDKRMDAITRLVQQGMRMLVETQAAQKELATTQKETHLELKALIKSLRNGRNGRNGH